MASAHMTSGSPFVSGALVAGKYRLIKSLGEGAMGVVWSAVNEVTSGEVALKLIWKPEQEYRVRLLREAKACGTVRHKNVIQIHDVGQTDSGDPFLVMELLSGETLAELLIRKRRLPPPEAAAIGRDIARGLAAAHAKGIVHRDLKPANIVLHNEPGEDTPVVKVLDFGVAKNLAVNDGLRTAVGGAVGSPMYMSPEQARKERDIDARADVWSLGVVLFEMLTGERPFQGDLGEVLLHIVKGEIPTVGRRLRRIDPALDQLIIGCLTRDREARLGPAAEIARLLDEHALPAARQPLPSLMEEGLSDRSPSAGAGSASSGGRFSPGAGSTTLQPSSSPGYSAASPRPSSPGYGPTGLTFASSPGHGATSLRPSSSEQGASPLHQSGSYSSATVPLSASSMPRVAAIAPSVSEDEAATHRLEPRHFAPPVVASPAAAPPVIGPSGTVRIDPVVVEQAIAARGISAALTEPGGGTTSSTAPVLHVDSPITNQPGQSGARRKALVAVVAGALLAVAVGVGFVVFRASPSGSPASTPPPVTTPSPSVTAAPPSVAPPQVTATSNSTPPAAESALPPAKTGAPTVPAKPASTGAPGATATNKPATPTPPKPAPRPEPCGKFVQKPGCIKSVSPYDPPTM